jgi:DNA-binding MarR family transcriptional regulator
MFDRCLYFNTTALARRLEREWGAVFSEFELTPPQAFMLRAILEHSGASQRELADMLAIAPSTATRALDKLQSKGLVERRGMLTDRREIAIHATPEGMALERRLVSANSAATSRMTGLLGDESLCEAVTKLKEVRSALG